MKSRPIDVLVYGTVCLDAIWRVEALPEADGFAPILDERTTTGGEAFNTCAALHKWGSTVALAGNPVGADARGKQLLSLIERDAPDLDMSYVEVNCDCATPFCACIATPDGKRTMFGTGFDAMKSPPPEKLPLRKARWFTMDPNAWDAGVTAGLAAAAAGCRVVAMDFLDSPAMCSAAEINLTSSSRLGTNLTRPVLLQKAAELRDRYNKTAIITHCEDGCFVAAAGRKGAVRMPAMRAPEVVDCTGAGDIFRAGLLLGLSSHWPLRECIWFASGAAALNCTAAGGWAGVVSRVETFKFLETAVEHEGLGND